MRLGEFHAWVSTDGIELAEFAVEYSADGKHASCWIPSECDKKLSTHYQGTEPEQPLSLNVEVTVDGIACGSHTLRCLPCLNVASGSRDSVATSAITRRPLMFARQVLTDDDDLLTAAISPELGTIKIEMRDVQSRPHWRNRESTWNNLSLRPQVLHERSKKAIEHSVQFGDEYLTANHHGDPIEVVQVLATFVFKYRPIELLRAQGIAPRPRAAIAVPTTPVEVVDLTMEDDSDGDNAAEIKRLEARLQLLKKKGAKVKSEPHQVKLEFVDLT